MLYYYSKVHQRAEDGKWRAAADVIDTGAGFGHATEFALQAVFDTEPAAEKALEQELLSKGYSEIYTPEKVAKVATEFLKNQGFKLDEKTPAKTDELVVFVGTQGATPLDPDTLPRMPGWMSPVVNCHQAFEIVGCKIEYAKVRQQI